MSRSAPLDVVVVGGGPAGLATAIAAAGRGLRVRVVDRRRPPLDKACGEGLMPAALAALAALGVDLAGQGAPLAGVRYRAGAGVAQAGFPDGARGLGLRRTELHAALAARAAAAGVELDWGCVALGLTGAGVATGAGALAARFVVGADGLRSPVRRWAGLERRPRRRPRFGVRRHLAVATGEHVEVIFGAGAELYVTPVGAGESGIAVLWQGAARGFDQLLATRFPAAVAARFAGADATSRDRGAGPFGQRARAVVAGRVALVGDAAGYLDPLTGEGLALACHEAIVLAGALAAGDLGGYPRAVRRLRRVPEAVTRLALVAARQPARARRLVAALGHDPELFGRLLGVLGCGRAPGTLGVLRALHLVARVLLPPGRPLD